MGLFLVQPLAQELALAVAPTSPLAHARRLLTMLVPLAYRPAMKVRTWDRQAFLVHHQDAAWCIWTFSPKVKPWK